MRPKHSTPPLRACLICGAAFTPRQVRPQRGMYCSLACKREGCKRGGPSAQGPRTAVARTCAHCGQSFTVWPSKARVGRGRYCSKACLNAAQVTRVPLTCAHCGKTFAAMRCEVKGGKKYCSSACAKAHQVGDQAPHWRGCPWRTDKSGHLFRQVGGRTIYQHREIMEQHLKRALLPGEEVHHKNLDPADNRLSNLQVMSSEDHKRLHFALWAQQWSRKFAACRYCGTTERPHFARGCCRSCYQQHPRERWSRDHDQCVRCGKTSVPHQAHGLCRHCLYKTLRPRHFARV